MSYDVAIVSPPIPADDSEAWKALDALIAKKGGRVPPILKSFYDLVTARFPCISSLRDDATDTGVWSMSPLWDGFGRRAAVLLIVYSRVAEVLPFLIETATPLNLAVFDWQTGQIHRADGFKGLTLTLEGKPGLLAPTAPQLRAAVDALTPGGGPGFLILDNSGQGYAQAAGGDGAYTAEWRKYSARPFRHWVAGLRGRPATNEVPIATNGFHITVKENERLTAVDVKTILSAFAEGKERPASFAWRDITDRFS